MTSTKHRRSWLRKAVDVITLRDPRNPQYVAVIPNPDAGGNDRVDAQRAIANADLSNVVMACVDWRSTMLVSAPLVLERRRRDGDVEPMPDHPMLKVLRNPRPGEYSGRVLLSAVSQSLDLCGYAYIRKVRFNGGASKMQLQFVPPWGMQPKLDDDGYIAYYERDVPRGAPERVPIEDVIHLRNGLDLRNPTQGVSPLVALGREIWTDDRAAMFTAGLLRNMGRPGLIMSVPAGTDPLSKEVRDETREYIKEKFTGQNVGETMFMGVPLDIRNNSFNPAEMSLTDVRNTVEERVCAMFKIPAVVVGYHSGLENANTRAGLTESERQAWESGIIPTQISIAEQIQAQLLLEFEPERNLDQFELRFDVSEIRALQPDLNRQAEQLRILVQSQIMTQGEARGVAGLEVGPEHDVFLYPLNISPVPAGQLPVAPEPAEPEETDDDEEEDALISESRRSNGMVKQLPYVPYAAEVMYRLEEEWRLDEEKRFGTILQLTKATLNQEQRELLIAEVRLARRLEANLTEPLTEAFDDLGRLVAEAYRAVAPSEASRGGDGFTGAVLERDNGEILGVMGSGGETIAGVPLARFVGYKQTPEDTDLVVRILQQFDLDQWQSSVAGSLFATHYLSALEGTVGNINSVLGLGVNIPDTVARRVVAEGGTRLGLLDIGKDTRESIFRALHAGRVAGEGPPVLARRIRGQVGAGKWTNAGPRYRAMVIARTETKYAQNISAIEAYERTDVVEMALLVDNQTGFGDADCSARDGQVVTFDEARRILAEEHPNNTLSISPVVRRA